MKAEVSEMIMVDFVEVTYKMFKPNVIERIQSGEIESKFLPRKGDNIVIGSTSFIVEQLTFYPFGDCEGTKGVRVYLSRLWS